MHPVAYLFEEIYGDYWGIPKAQREHDRERRETPFAARATPVAARAASRRSELKA